MKILPKINPVPRIPCTIFQKCFYTFHGAVLVYAGILITAATLTFTQGLSGQSQFYQQQTDRRLENLEGMNLDRRLAVVESTLQDIRTEVHAATQEAKKDGMDYMRDGGIGLILLRFGYDAVVTKKKKDENDDE